MLDDTDTPSPQLPLSPDPATPLKDGRVTSVRQARKTLIDRWQAAYGQPPPKGISHRLLEYAAAYREQVGEFGGLSTATRRELSKIATRTASQPERLQKKRRSLPPGARLVREWQGAVHCVDVTDSGYLYRGVIYGSLSEIARLITGTRWSGPRFFGSNR